LAFNKFDFEVIAASDKESPFREFFNIDRAFNIMLALCLDFKDLSSGENFEFDFKVIFNKTFECIISGPYFSRAIFK
jgi:hypothetical protein